MISSKSDFGHLSSDEAVAKRAPGVLIAAPSSTNAVRIHLCAQPSAFGILMCVGNPDRSSVGFTAETQPQLQLVGNLLDFLQHTELQKVGFR